MEGRIVNRGMGSFLCPPTHPMHNYSVETDLRRRPENRGGVCLTTAVDAEWLDASTRATAQRILDEWVAPELSTVQEWVLQVLGYFSGCYNFSTDEGGWNADKLTIDMFVHPMKAIDYHAGVHRIRKYYPDFMPTQAQFNIAHWGTE